MGFKDELLSDPPVIKICEWGPWARKLHCTLDSQALSGSQTDILNLLTLDNSFPPLDYDIFAKTRRKMSTASIFSRQNDAGSQASTC